MELEQKRASIIQQLFKITIQSILGMLFDFFPLFFFSSSEFDEMCLMFMTIICHSRLSLCTEHSDIISDGERVLMSESGVVQIFSVVLAIDT